MFYFKNSIDRYIEQNKFKNFGKDCLKSTNTSDSHLNMTFDIAGGSKNIHADQVNNIVNNFKTIKPNQPYTKSLTERDRDGGIYTVR